MHTKLTGMPEVKVRILRSVNPKKISRELKAKQEIVTAMLKDMGLNRGSIEPIIQHRNFENFDVDYLERILDGIKWLVANKKIAKANKSSALSKLLLEVVNSAKSNYLFRQTAHDLLLKLGYKINKI